MAEAMEADMSPEQAKAASQRVSKSDSVKWKVFFLDKTTRYEESRTIGNYLLFPFCVSQIKTSSKMSSST